MRSQGGWAGVKALRESGDYQKGDERILGDGSFVQQVLSETEERLERRYRLRTRGYDFDRIVERVSELVGITPEEVMKQGKIRGHLRGKARSLLCYWASAEIGVKQGRLAEILKVTQPAISMAVRRGAELVKEDNLSVER